MTGILIYQLKWRLHMAVASAWFTSHVLPICVEGAVLCVSLTCTLLTPAMWVSAHTMQFSATAAGCPAIPLHSDTNWSQCRLHRLRAQSPGLPSYLRWPCVSLVVTGASDQLAIKHRFPDSFLGVLSSAQELTEFWETHTYIY